MKTIATALQKGGVGKTTMAVSIAAELAKKGATIIVDADPQGNTTGSLLDSFEFEFADYLFKSCSLEDAIYKTAQENLFILPTFPVKEGLEEGLNRLRSYKQTSAVRNLFAIDDMVEKLKDKFEYCVFDTSPAFDTFEENIFIACDEVIGVIRADQFSNDGLTIFGMNLKDFKEHRRSAKPNFDKVILNGYDARYSFHNDLLKVLEEQKAFQHFVVPTDPAFGRSQVLHKPIQLQKDAKKETLSVFEKIAEVI